jgi:putative endonuclease
VDWIAYILRCGDGTLYTGVTNDLDRRVSAHQKGVGARYTRSRRPVELVLQESVAGRGAALKREAEIRRLTRAQKLELIARAEDDVAARRTTNGKTEG